MICEGGQMPYRQHWYFQNSMLVTKNYGQTYIGLSHPCRGRYDYELTHQEFTCEHTGNHGHVVLMDHDDVCVMPSPIYSQSMLGSVLAHLVQQAHLTREEMRAILSQAAVNELPKELTENEKSTLANSVTFNSFCDLGGFFRF